MLADGAEALWPEVNDRPWLRAAAGAGLCALGILVAVVANAPFAGHEARLDEPRAVLGNLIFTVDVGMLDRDAPCWIPVGLPIAVAVVVAAVGIALLLGRSTLGTKRAGAWLVAGGFAAALVTAVAYYVMLNDKAVASSLNRWLAVRNPEVAARLVPLPDSYRGYTQFGVWLVVGLSVCGVWCGWLAARCVRQRRQYLESRPDPPAV